jgi:hypothetical protein
MGVLDERETETASPSKESAQCVALLARLRGAFWLKAGWEVVSGQG